MAFVIKDLTGARFGRLTVVKMTPERRGGAVVWLCQCDCGGMLSVNGAQCSHPFAFTLMYT
jgi:hypothetical protein